MSVIITKTNHFQSLRAAREYYALYGYSDVDGVVATKIAEGEIVISLKPELKPGQRFQWDRQGRGMITEIAAIAPVRTRAKV